MDGTWVNDAALAERAPAGGCVGVDGHYRRGGEFEPFYVPRMVMPQVHHHDYTALFEWAAFKGIEVSTVERSTDELKFRQHVDVKTLHVSPKNYDKPILISSDGFVLDGNHRATAHKLKGDPVTCIMFDADFESAMKLLFSFAGTYCIENL